MKFYSYSKNSKLLLSFVKLFFQHLYVFQYFRQHFHTIYNLAYQWFNYGRNALSHKSSTWKISKSVFYMQAKVVVCSTSPRKSLLKHLSDYSVFFFQAYSIMMEQKRQKYEALGKKSELQTKKIKEKLEIASKYSMKAKKLLCDLNHNA